MTKLLKVASAGLLVAALAACGNTIQPVDPFPNEERITVSASTDGSTPAITGASASGSGQLIEVNIPDAVLEQDVVWFELANVSNVDRLILYDSIAGVPREAVLSVDAGWFDVPGQIDEVPPGLETTQIIGELTCAGPCIGYATDNNIGLTRYLRVVPEAGTTATFDFYVFGEDRFPDDQSNGLRKDDAIVIDAGTAVNGHIVYSDMERWYKVESEVTTVTLTHPPTSGENMEFKASVFVGGEVVERFTLTAETGSRSFNEPVSDVWIHVTAFNESRAAAPGYANFTVLAE